MDIFKLQIADYEAKAKIEEEIKKKETEEKRQQAFNFIGSGCIYTGHPPLIMGGSGALW